MASKEDSESIIFFMIRNEIVLYKYDVTVNLLYVFYN